MRPSRLQTTTLCVSSDMSAARRDFSCSMPCAASCTLASISRRRSSRCPTSWLNSPTSTLVSSLPLGVSSRTTSVRSSTCASSASCTEGVTQWSNQRFRPQAMAAIPAPHVREISIRRSPSRPQMVARSSGSRVEPSRPNVASNQATDTTAATTSSHHRRRSVFCCPLMKPHPAARVPSGPVPWSKTAWSCKRWRPAPGPWPRRCRGLWP
ncbi:hypothetical protein Y695_03247 [Hydrogenophaga sp. T4]|nr:hypothetical protein Y695_03247 [Hydrogenophaga sp. T4]